MSQIDDFESVVAEAAQGAVDTLNATAANLNPNFPGFAQRFATYQAAAKIAFGTTYSPPDSSGAAHVTVGSLTVNVTKIWLNSRKALQNFIVATSISQAEQSGGSSI